MIEQLESIKILEPVSYELNLRKLYEYEDHIIQIQEDGKYVIQMAEWWADWAAQEKEIDRAAQ